MAKFYAASTFAAVANTDWEGEIKNLGDKVIINNIPSITIRDYKIGDNLNYEVPEPNTIELAIDTSKYFAVNISDVIEYQSNLQLMDMFTNDASEQMRVAIDTDCWNAVKDGTHAANTGSTAGVKSGALDLGTTAAPVALTPSNVVQSILKLATALDEQNTPEDGRWLVMDPYTRMLLVDNNSGIGQVQITGDGTSPVRNGKIGMIDRFETYVSNLLPSGAGYRYIFAGHRSALTLASQVTKVETLRNPTDFGELVRGLNVYGKMVVKPEHFAQLIAN